MIQGHGDGFLLHSSHSKDYPLTMVFLWTTLGEQPILGSSSLHFYGLGLAYFPNILAV